MGSVLNMAAKEVSHATGIARDGIAKAGRVAMVLARDEQWRDHAVVLIGADRR